MMAVEGGIFLDGKTGKWNLGVPVVAAHPHGAPNIIVSLGMISRGAFKVKCTTIYRLSYQHALYPAVAHTEAMTAKPSSIQTTTESYFTEHDKGEQRRAIYGRQKVHAS